MRFYVEVTNEENEAEHVDDCNDSVSLDSQLDEHMNWLFYGVCFSKSSKGLVILSQHQGLEKIHLYTEAAQDKE